MSELFTLNNVKYNQWVSINNVNIPQGKITFIVGDSGSGKSTLLKMLNASISPSQGEIFYRDKDLLSYDTLELRKEVSLIGQDSFLFDETIEKNFEIFYSFRDQKSPEKEKIKSILNICGIDFPLDKDCSTMSGGERQRVFIAIFLSFKPKVLLMDEPTSALDEKTALKAIENIINYCKEENIDFIAVSHSKNLVSKFAEEIIEITKEVSV